jgi:hypothetical protein
MIQQAYQPPFAKLEHPSMHLGNSCVKPALCLPAGPITGFPTNKTQLIAASLLDVISAANALMESSLRFEQSKYRMPNREP